MNTPWGESQTMDKIIDGMYIVTTAGHGGIYLYKSLERKVLAMFPTIVNNDFYHRQFWEEDCMWCFPYIAFSDELKHLPDYKKNFKAAFETLESTYPEEFAHYMQLEMKKFKIN